MRAELTQKINPITPSIGKDFNTKKSPTIGTNSENKVDFLKLMNNSNTDIKNDRQAQKNGDLSGAKNYQEMLDKLQESTKKLRAPKNKLDKDDFLKLFVTQLKNQDPLNPDDGTEMASKLAQFNSLEQMLNVNKTLTKMLDQQQQGRSVDLVNYVGKEIEIDGGRLRLQDGELSDGEFTVKRSIANATMEVRDGAGKIVSTKNLGAIPEGTHKVNWDPVNKEGVPASNGVYSFSINGKGLNDEDIPVSIHTKTKITGVDLKDNDGGVFTDLGRVKLDEIKSIGNSEYNAAQKAVSSKPAGKKIDPMAAAAAGQGLPANTGLTPPAPAKNRRVAKAPARKNPKVVNDVKNSNRAAAGLAPAASSEASQKSNETQKSSLQRIGPNAFPQNPASPATNF